MSASPTGRRYARRASVFRIVAAHASFSAPAHEDPPPARRLAGVHVAERPADLDRGDAHRLVAVAGVFVRRDRQLGLAGAFWKPALGGERDAEIVRPRRDRQASDQLVVCGQLVRRGARHRRPRIARSLAADTELTHAPPVEPQLDCVRLAQPANLAGVGSLEPDPDLVLPVGREVMTHRRAAARAERQRLAHPVALEQRLRHAVGLDRRPNHAAANRQLADLAGGGHVALQERRRQREHIGDVVEAVARIVGRQERSNVDFEREQIAHRVGVFGAVQPMNDRASWIRVRGAVRVERRFDPFGDRVIRWTIRPRHPHRRHGAAAQPGRNFFQRARVRRDVGQVQRVERQIRRRALLVVAADAIPIERRPA